MPDQPLTTPPATHDTNAAGDPPKPSLPPPVEGNKDSEANHNKATGDKVEKPKEHWTKYVEAFCGLALVAITWYYTKAAYRQAASSEAAASAAQGAVTVASNTLTETQRSNARQEWLNDQARKEAKIESDAASANTKIALQSTIDNFRQQQRAYLIPGDPEDTSGYGLLRFPIINYGHTTATHVAITTDFQRIKIDLSTGKSTPLDQRTLTIQSVPTITPSEKPTFYMLVFIPQQESNAYSVELSKGEQYIIAHGTIEYDSGHGRDTIPWSYSWNPVHARWENRSGSATAWLGDATNTTSQPPKK